MTHSRQGLLPLLLSVFCVVFIPLQVTNGEVPTPTAKAEEISLVRVTPEGTGVEPSSQVVFEFSRPVVPLGRMERASNEIGITFSPSLDCQWRWASTSSLTCTLNEDARPRPATLYTITIPRAFDRARGDVLAADLTRTFETTRPTVSSSWFRTWRGPGLPLIDISANQRVSRRSLSKHLVLVDSRNVEHEIDVTPWKPLYEEGSEEEAPEEEPDTQTNEQFDGRRWTISPTKELPLDTAISLKLRAGFSSSEGNLTSTDERTIVQFHTFPEFRFLGISCYDLKRENVSIPADADAATVTQRCDPLNAIQLAFSAPVLKEGVKDAIITKPDLRGGRTDFDPWEDVYSYSQLQQPHTQGRWYLLGLPYGLKANATYSLNAAAGAVQDQFGRTLATDLSFAFNTDHRAPRLVLDNPMSVLEKDTDSKLPLVVNNLKKVRLSYQSVTTDANQSGLSTTLSPYNVQDIAYPFPIDVRAMLGGRSGVIQGKISSTPASDSSGQWFFSQVTPYAVHVKLGHYNSLVWVTSLSTGEPIANAKVSIVSDTLTKLAAQPKALATGQTDSKGIASLTGTQVVDPNLTLISQWQQNKPRLMVRVEKDGEMALVPIWYDFQAYAGDAYPTQKGAFGHMHAWGTTAQGLYKAGDTIQFSLWVRDQDNNGFIASRRDGYKLEVSDPTGKVVYTVPDVNLSEFGAFSGEFATKKDAAVGWYTFRLSASFTKETWEPLKVLVSDFTPAPFKVNVEVGKELVRQGDTVTIDTEARLHAGGPYTNAAVRITASVKGQPITPSDQRLKDFSFDSTYQEAPLFQQEEKLDNRGDHSMTTSLPTLDIPYGDLFVESAVRDDRGKFVASMVKTKYVGRDRFVGLAQNDWLLTAHKPTSTFVAVIDERGNAVAGTPAHVTVQYEDTKAARVKSAGNTYITRYENEWVEVTTCDVTSTTEGVKCDFTPEKPGRYRINATVTDSEGREHATSLDRWATGSGSVLWNTDTNTELQVIAEKKSYAIGETARFMVQNPYPGARALFTVERYGVQRSWIRVLKESTEVIEVPVTKEQSPGFYFSATVISPRVDKPIEGQVDLGKPTFKMGYASISVTDPTKGLAVEVKPRGELFKPRDTVTVDIAAKTVGSTQPELEFAVTVLDESVFDLIQGGKEYFDPHKGFYTLDGLDVKNYNIIKMLIGRQKFEKKGANAGGDGGGNLDMRSLKKFVSYWNPAVKADNNGRATITFEAPDNLTGWKVFAIAMTKKDLMALGEGAFKVNKQTEVRTALPNQVREGDTFTASFTVMNRSDTPRTLTVEARADGEAATAKPRTITIKAEPFTRYPVDVTATAVKSGEARFIVKASDAADSDSMLGTVTVLPRAALQTAATFGSAEGAAVSEAVAFPQDMRTDAGSVGVVLSSSIIGGLDGAFSYMKEYPYSCWEQKLSKGVMAAHAIALKAHLPKSFQWNEAQKVISDTLGAMSSFQAANGGMTFYTPSDEHVSPYLSAYTALALTWLGDQGYVIPTAEEERLQGYLASILKNEALPTFYSEGMKSSVRAVALAALARRGKADRADLMRYKDAVKSMSVFGKAHYLVAAVALKADTQLINDTINQILSFGNESGATYVFTEPVEAVSERVLDSNMRTQCAATEALLDASERSSTEVAQRISSIVPRLVRSITLERKRKDRWENTQENLFCMNALARYSAVYEKSLPNLDLAVAVGDEPLANVAMKGFSAEPLEVSRPLTAADVGTTKPLTVSPTGTGRFYYSARLAYSPKDISASATNAGIEIVREYSVKRNGSWTILKAPVAIKQGELVKVDLFVRLAAPRNYVVVDDPIPGGLEAVNRDLATSSSVDADEGAFVGAQNSFWFDHRDWRAFGFDFWSFYHKELRHSAARFYSEYLPAGNYHLSYVSQAIAQGEFVILPTHAEAMYDPDIFGKSAADTLRVEAQ